jgi:hypothetical protein
VPITGPMSLPATLARISEIHQILQGPTAPPPTAAPASTAFAGALQNATFGSAASPNLGVPVPAAALASAMPAGGTPAGQAVLNLVRNEVGVAEQPPGSNDAPRIAQYRQATVGSGVGPWCAYFTSWAAREAGVPLGDAGQGFGRVDDVWSWAQGAGKSIPAGSGAPQPGDLIVWDEHIGVVESVDPDGSIHTVEGNSSDRVNRRDYGADGGGAIGYVRLG